MNFINKSTPLEIFNNIFQKVRKDENYIPRSYHTIGSFWTVDTWSDGRCQINLEDEGYSKLIIVPGLLRCRTNYKNDITYLDGDENSLMELGRMHLPEISH